MSPRDRNGAVGAPEPMPLTPRELEVATLISRGHTNRRIAEALVIAERTAETHARNIREKLGLTTRAQIGAWAVYSAAQAAIWARVVRPSFSRIFRACVSAVRSAITSVSAIRRLV